MNNPVLDNEYWHDIFNGIIDDVISPDMIPLQYVLSVSVMFDNNKQFEIPVTNIDKNWDTFYPILYEFIQKYNDNVSAISYNIDVDTIQHDISTLTTKFLNKYNL